MKKVWDLGLALAGALGYYYSGSRDFKGISHTCNIDFEHRATKRRR